MKIFLQTLLLTFTLLINFCELWAADHPDHQLPPPGPNRFEGYRNGHTFYQNRRLIGTLVKGHLVLIHPNKVFTPTPYVAVKPKDLLPDRAEVWRPKKRIIGYIFDRKIHGRTENGVVGVIGPKDGDIVVHDGRAIAKYTQGWKEFHLHETPNASSSKAIH